MRSFVLSFILLFLAFEVANSTLTFKPIVIIKEVFVKPKISKKEINAGIASFYGKEFHKRITANGDTFDTSKYTAAHKTLPFGTKLLITNQYNNKSVIVIINDRGPYYKNRILDLSKQAASDLGMLTHGITRVKFKKL